MLHLEFNLVNLVLLTKKPNLYLDFPPPEPIYPFSPKLL